MSGQDIVAYLRENGNAARIARRAMELGASQEEGELREAILQVAAVEPRIIVELGCDRGGTLYAWGQVLAPGGRVLGITWGANADSGGAVCEPHGAVMHYGDTHDPRSVMWLSRQLAGEPVDVLVIDGDHFEDGVRADLHDYGPWVRPGGLIMLHDIRPEGYPAVQVWKVWPGLRERYQTSEIGSNFGWGIIHVRDEDHFGEA